LDLPGRNVYITGKKEEGLSLEMGNIERVPVMNLGDLGSRKKGVV